MADGDEVIYPLLILEKGKLTPNQLLPHMINN